MSRVETADGYYGFVAQLNPDWRVVECRDRIQWILQRRGSPKMSRRDDWRGRSYCRTSQALIRSAREYAGSGTRKFNDLALILSTLIDKFLVKINDLLTFSI
jgi:hypothetical protein